MKEVVKVSISGIAFTFEYDAYKVMNDYLKKLEAGYAKHPDGREIVADIEARVAELILEHQESDKVIGKPLTEEIVRQMGYPDDMDSGEETVIENFPRRFYRNPDGAKLAGICSGLGAYFKVDPVWIRLGIFAPLLLAILFGRTVSMSFFILLCTILVLLYFILWIAVPMAKTPRQKLEMRGERVTADSIRQEFEDEASARPSADPAKSRKNASVWADIVYTIGRIFLVILKIILFFVAFAIGVVLISLLVAIVAMVFGLNIAFGGELLALMDGMVGIGPVGFGVIWMFIVFIPLFVLLYWLITVIFRSRTNRPFLIATWVIWLLLLIWGVALTVRNADTIRYGVEEFIEKIDNDELEIYFEEYIDDYIFDVGSGTERIRRVDGGPIIIERGGGRQEVIVFPDDDEYGGTDIGEPRADITDASDEDSAIREVPADEIRENDN